jgi:hypothetical protein
MIVFKFSERMKPENHEKILLFMLFIWPTGVWVAGQEQRE